MDSGLHFEIEHEQPWLIQLASSPGAIHLRTVPGGGLFNSAEATPTRVEVVVHDIASESDKTFFLCLLHTVILSRSKLLQLQQKFAAACAAYILNVPFYQNFKSTCRDCCTRRHSSQSTSSISFLFFFLQLRLKLQFVFGSREPLQRTDFRHC